MTVLNIIKYISSGKKKKFASLSHDQKGKNPDDWCKNNRFIHFFRAKLEWKNAAIFYCFERRLRLF